MSSTKGHVVKSLTSHIVEGDSANHQLDVMVQDEPGSGGANHAYHITGFNGMTNPSALAPFVGLSILFQNGPIKEVGVNGITNEALLAILIHRMEGFQAGPFASRDNADALSHMRGALIALQRRTRARIERGVEGTHAV